jgi:DMSO/TMAO reductase YedYZ molybdopterin-dependent catalytic subunit
MNDAPIPPNNGAPLRLIVPFRTETEASRRSLK